MVFRAARLVRTRAEAQAGRAEAGQRRHLRGVLRALYRRAVGQHATVVDRRRGARLARIVTRQCARAGPAPWSASPGPRAKALPEVSRDARGARRAIRGAETTPSG